MKKLAILLLFLSLAVGFYSCSEDETEREMVAVNISEIKAPFEGNTTEIDVNSNVAWKATVVENYSWVSVTPGEGNGRVKMSITVAANEGEKRSAEVKLFSNKALVTIRIQQDAAPVEEEEPKPSYTPISEVRAKYTGTDFKITDDITISGVVISDYRRNTSGGLNNYTSAKGMIISDGESGIMLYCAADNTDFARGDKVTVSLKGQTLSVYNNGPLQVNGCPLENITKIGTETPVAKEITAAELLTGKYESMYVAVKDVQVVSEDLEKTFVMGGNHTSIAMEAKTGEMFDIFSSKYAVFADEKVPQGSGILKGIAGVNNGKYQISISEKADYASLTGERFASAPKFSLEFTEIEIAGDASSFKVNLTANVEWTAVSSVADFTLSQSSGNDNAEITVSYNDNPSSENPREAVITFTTANDGVAQKELKLKITQRAYEKLVSDAVNSWMELPLVKTSENMTYISHNVDLKGKSVRNYSYMLDAENRYATWVAYPLYKGIDENNTSRSDEWGYDPKVPKRCQPVLYKSWGVSGYDRGHQLPSADRLHSVAANVSTFYFTNMTAQNSNLNQGIWGNLETRVRNWVNGCDTLYVVTGAVATTKENTTVEFIKDNEGKDVAIPKAYFKVVLRYSKSESANGGYSAIGFWFENKTNSQSTITASHAKSVKTIEELTGFDFFTNLDDTVEAAVEESVTNSVWGL